MSTLGFVQSAVALSAVLAVAPAACAEPTAFRASRNVTVTLVPETDALEPGRPLSIGLHFKMAPEWHTYWRNPGDAGLPIRIQWRLPEGFSAGDTAWPRPERFATGPLVSYGYAHEVLLLTEIRPPTTATSGEVKIGARVAWLECKEACLPGKADLEIALPVAKAPRRLAAWAPTFRRFRERQPRADVQLEAEAEAVGEDLILTVGGVPAPRQAYFFAARPEVVEHGAAQRLSQAGSGFRLQLTRAANAAVPQRIEGVLEADGEAYEIRAVVRSTLQTR